MRERIPSIRLNKEIDTSEIEDELQDEPSVVSALFRKLPRELWKRHFVALRQIGLDQQAAGIDTAIQKKTDYLSKVLEARRSGIEEYKSNDARFSEKQFKDEIGNRAEELLNSPEGMLGAGQTARVKSLALSDDSTIAIKYLLTPTDKTLSAQGEHDTLYEVETITRIEVEETKLDAGKRIRVPHPCFFYKNDKIQCYGMQEIRGMTVAELLDANTPNTVALNDRREAIWKALRGRYANSTEQEALFTELDSFAQAMHEVCLHGDVKFANMMVDEQGDMYLIDFGQAVDANLMTEKTREQFENLQTLERQQLASCIHAALRSATE